MAKDSRRGVETPPHAPAQIKADHLLEDERVIRQVDDTKWLWKKWLPVDGILQLTNRRLRFLSLGVDSISYSLDDVVSINLRAYWGVLPLGMLVEFSDGRRELFGVTKRKRWASEILAAKASLGPVSKVERTADGTILDSDMIAFRQESRGMLWRKQGTPLQEK